MNKALFALSFSLLSPLAFAQTQTQAFLTLKSFECVSRSYDCTVNQSLYSSLKEALQNSGRFRIFDNLDISELTLSGAITDVRQETKVFVKVSVELKDHITSEVIWSGNFEGSSASTDANVFGITVQGSNTVSQAAASVATQITSKLLEAPALKGYLTHQPGERPVPRQAQNTVQPSSSTQPQITAAPAAGLGNVDAVVSLLLMSLKTLNFQGINNLLTDDYTNVFTMEGLQKQVTPEAIGKASQVQYRYQLQSPAPQLSTLNLAYTLPGQSEKVISLVLMDATTMGIPGKTGVRVVYFAPTNPYAMAMSNSPMFKASLDGVNQLLADVKSTAGIQ